MAMESASIIFVSDEILRNTVSPNEPLSFLIRELNTLHYVVKKISIVSEDIKEIYNEFKSILPHCDITIIIAEVKNGVLYRALSSLFSQELKCNSTLANVLDELHETYDSETISTPVTARLLTSNQNPTTYPVVYLQRMFILDVRYLEHTFDLLLKEHLAYYRTDVVHNKIIQINPNGHSDSYLHDLISKWSNCCVHVALSRESCLINIQISSANVAHLVNLERNLKRVLGSYLTHSVNSLNNWEAIYESDEILVNNAIQNIEKSLLEYGPENVFVCFNGGKDCTVLLHLVLVVLKKRFPNYKSPVFCLYVQSESPFPEQNEFIALCQDFYNLEIMAIQSGIKDALKQTLEKDPNYRASLMGTRRTDPFSSGLNVFQMTDTDWPQIMRVSPLLDWHYSDIWDYLLFYKIPYCKLYDMGYTSLGNTENTVKNPSLIYYDVHEGNETYLPAYKLLKETKERNGRDSR